MRSSINPSLILIIIFIISVLSPFVISNETVEAHADPPGQPIKVEVIITKMMSKNDLDDPFWGGDSEVIGSYKLEHAGHTPANSINGGQGLFSCMDWNMESQNWDTTKNAYTCTYKNGGRLIYSHTECTPMNTITFTIDQAIELDRAIGTENGLMLGGTGTALWAGLVGATGGVALIIPVVAGTASWALSQNGDDNLGTGAELWNKAGTKDVWTTGGFGLEVIVKETAIKPGDPNSDICNYTNTSTEINSSQYLTAHLDNQDSWYWNSIERNGHGNATMYPHITDRISPLETVNGTFVLMNKIISQMAESGISIEPDDENDNVTNDAILNSVDVNQTIREMILTIIHQDIKIMIATVNSSLDIDVSKTLGWLYYAELALGSNEWDMALNSYHAAAYDLVNSVIEYDPMSSITIEAIDRDTGELMDDVGMEILELDCEKCEPILIGGGGGANVELPAGDYELQIKDKDGQLLEKRTFEVKSGVPANVMVDVSTAEQALNLAFYLQGLIIASLPALVGFTGSKQYLERKLEPSESKSEPSTTPLWIGVVTFLAIFFMMIG
jgi:hypothetical protein